MGAACLIADVAGWLVGWVQLRQLGSAFHRALNGSQAGATTWVPEPPLNLIALFCCRSQLDNVLARQAQLQLLWDQHASGATAAFSTGGTNGSTSTAGWTNGSVAAPGLQPAAATW